MKKDKKIKEGVLKIYKGGFGFVLQEEEDIFIPRKEVKKAGSGDVVKVQIIKRGRKPEGKIIGVVKKSEKKLTGTWINKKIIPDDPYLPVLYVKKKTERPMKVIFSMERKIKIEEVLGEENDPQVDDKVIIARFGFKENFSPTVLKEASKRIKIRDKRSDLTKELVYTIDPKDAKDFDDAISVKKKKNCYILGVHIADISSLIKEGGFMDEEARNRGTSVYLLQKVIPMLPENISKDKGSLLPMKKRFTFSVFMKINKEGKVISFNFSPSVIISKARLTYEDAMNILEGKKIEHKETVINIEIKRLRTSLKVGSELADILWEERRKRGGLDFDLPDPFFLFSPSGRIQDISPIPRLKTHRMIEEFMIVANRCVASYLENNKIPAIFRVHEPPKKEKLNELSEVLSSIFKEKIEIKDNRDIITIIGKAKKINKERLVSYLVLRSLSRAKYLHENKGHFGLALSEYLHFTSPIRRYPDLVVHRILKNALKGYIKRDKKWLSYLKETAEIATEKEEKAEKAEMELWELKKMEFMKDKVGEVFEGTVTNILPSGVFVEIEEYLVEGFIPIEAFKKGILYSSETLSLVNKKGSKVLGLGDRIKVQVSAVWKWQKRLDFVPVD